MMAALADNALLAALIWMILANLLALGPNRFKIAVLAAMLVTAGVLIPLVIRQNGWIIGLPVALLMLFQLRWTAHFVARLLRRYGLLPPR